MPTRLRLVLVALLVVVGGTVWAGWAWRHPHAFLPYGGGNEYLSAAKVGETSYFGVYDLNGSMPRITLRSARLKVEANTADATVELLVCTPKRVDGSAGIGVASGRDGQRFCDFAPIAGAVLDPTVAPRHQLILAITPHQPGRVKVGGMDLRYDSGWQSGSQHIGFISALRAH